MVRPPLTAQSKHVTAWGWSSFSYLSGPLFFLFNYGMLAGSTMAAGEPDDTNDPPFSFQRDDEGAGSIKEEANA